MPESLRQHRKRHGTGRKVGGKDRRPGADNLYRAARLLMGGDMYIKHMKSIILILTAVAVLIPALAGSPEAAVTRRTREDVVKSEETKKTTEPTTTGITRGKRGRRLSRVDAWVQGLEGDKKRIFDRYGHPSGRRREMKMGDVIEIWVYSGQNRTFRFKGNRLVN
jgi:hypothetical protein